MMCFKHNKFYRVGRCPMCIEETEKLEYESLILLKEIRELELENREITALIGE